MTVIPEVCRGAYRVPFGTEPKQASILAAKNRLRRKKLLAAAYRRRKIQ